MKQFIKSMGFSDWTTILFFLLSWIGFGYYIAGNEHTIYGWIALPLLCIGVTIALIMRLWKYRGM